MAPAPAWCRVPAWRAGRGVVVGTTAVGLAAAGHSVGGGSVTAAALLPWLGLGIAAATLLSDRVWTVPRLLGALTVVQVVLHVGLGHDAAAHAAVHVPTVPAGAMLAGHAAAVVLTALLLRRGEALADWIVTTLTRPLRTVAAVRVPVPARGGSVLARAGVARGSFLRYVIARRGPPLGGPAPLLT